MWISKKRLSSILDRADEITNKITIALGKITRIAQLADAMNAEPRMLIVNKSGFELPKYATEGSAGMDLRACIKAPVVLEPGHRKLIPTGIYITLPPGYEAQVRPRSGLAFKSGITVLNAPGTIDSDFLGEIGVILINHSDKPFMIDTGDRIAQMIIAKYSRPEIEIVEELPSSERGANGFGSSGVK